MLEQLFGQPANLRLVWSDEGRSIEGYLSDVYNAGMVINKQPQANGDLLVTVWINEQSLARLIATSDNRIEVK